MTNRAIAQSRNRVILSSPWILAARPKTLSAALAPVIVGTALAFADRRQLSWSLFAFTLLGALFIQIGTNLANDVLDFKRGTDTGQRLGPVRVTQAGLLPPRAVLRGALVSFALAALCGIPLILRGGLPILIIGLASILAGYSYTGGPYPLAYHGLGEIFVILFFGLIAVGGTYYLQTLALTPAALLAGLAIGSLATVLLVINNLRDIEDDRRSGKRTMAVRLGPRHARLEVALFALAPFFLAVAIALGRERWAVIASLLALPLALVLIREVSRAQGSALNRCLAMAAGLQSAFALLFAIGIIIA